MTERSFQDVERRVRIDPLTRDCLSLAASPNESCQIHERLRGFFRDLRRRLNQLKMGLYVARNTSAPTTPKMWDSLDDAYQAVEKLVERFEGICRRDDLTPLACDLDLMIADRRACWERLIASASGFVVWDAPVSAVVGRFDPVRLLNALDAFVQWRARELPQGTRVRVGWGAADDSLRFRWEESWDSLPEVLDGSRDEISLALPVLVSVISAHGGRSEVSAEDRLLVELEWPRG